MKEKRRRGWPARNPAPGERVPMSFRTEPDRKRRLDAFSAQSGRTIAAIVEGFVDRGLDNLDRMPEWLADRFGNRQLAALVLMIASGMNHTGRRCAAAAAGDLDAAETWMASSYAYDQAVRSATYILDAMRPPGVPQIPQVDKAYLGAPPEEVGRLIGFFTITAAKEPDQLNRGLPKERQNPDREMFFQQINALLGDAAAEIRIPTRFWYQPALDALECEVMRVPDAATQEAVRQRLQDLRLDIRDMIGADGG